MLAREIKPEWRWDALLNAVEQGRPPKKGTYLLEVYNVIVGKTKDLDIEYALDLIRVREHKEVLQAFFFCRDSLPHVSEVLEIELGVLEHVEKLIMDHSQFRNKLEIISYVRDLLNNDTGLSERGREYIEMGMQHGPDLLAQHFRLGNESIQLDPKKMIEHFVMTAYYLSANARSNSITADTTKQARMWMLDIIRYLEARKEAEGGSDANRDALLAIEERRATVTAEELGIDPGDIYH